MNPEMLVVLYATVADGVSEANGEAPPASRRERDEVLARFADTLAEAGVVAVEHNPDILLASCEKPAAALQLAADFQRSFSSTSPGSDLLGPSPLRIGIAGGSAEASAASLDGEVAATAERLSQLAVPGGIYASRAVVDAVKGAVDVGFVDHGFQFVKRADHSVNLFEVLLDPTDAGTVRPRVEQVKPPAWPWLVAAVVFWIVLVALIA